jgi:hypothetical protein
MDHPHVPKHILDALDMRDRLERLTPKPFVFPSPPPPPPGPYDAWSYRNRLLEWIADFERSLDEETEVGVRLVSFGHSVTFHLSDVTASNPGLIRFDGRDSSGQLVQLLQHVSQISVLLIGMQKLGEEPVRIGFVRPDDDVTAGEER